MLLEFDADQRLWQGTVRDAVSKQCPASLIRGIAARAQPQLSLTRHSYNPSASVSPLMWARRDSSSLEAAGTPASRKIFIST